jgi:hypothetical protein
MLIVVTGDFLKQICGHQRDHRPRAPPLLLQGQFKNVRLLFRNMPVQQCLIFLEIADSHSHFVAVAARVGNEVARGKDPRRKNLACPLLRTQRQNVLSAIPGIEYRGNTGIQKARECGEPFLAVGRREFGIYVSADLEAASQMNVHIDQARNQIFARSVDAPGVETPGAVKPALEARGAQTGAYSADSFTVNDGVPSLPAECNFEQVD